MTDTAAKPTQVFVHDDIHPEDNAMLQALYSRSPASVVTHLEKVRASGSGKFMENFYVGYGHASIGDCGTTTVFMENWSMLAAKAIQNSPLYSGQEASTRYLDFAAQPMRDPFGTPRTSEVQAKWMALYNHYMPLMKEAIARERPFNPADYKSEKGWQSAVAARAFDTLRSLLPLGCTTLFSWTTNLRQARDHLSKLACHPLPEVQQLARQTFQQLYAKYPHSFTGKELDGSEPRYVARHNYEAAHAIRDHVQDWPTIVARYQLTQDEQDAVRHGDIVTRTSHLDAPGLLRDCRDALADRPEGALLPQHLKAYGAVDMIFTLDFGSFRDLQRHRGGLTMHFVPMVDNTFGFNTWYLSEFERLLPGNGRDLIRAINDLLAELNDLKAQGHDPLLLQYLYPMGMNGAVTLSYTLPQLVYVAELRSAKTVHPSLRPAAQQMGRWCEQTFPGIRMYMDYDADGWTAKRGEQDIKPKAA